jgi:hypothetical protein
LNQWNYQIDLWRSRQTLPRKKRKVVSEFDCVFICILSHRGRRKSNACFCKF